MFGDINNATLMGNVTKDPDLRYTPSGAAVLSFSLATNRRYKKGEEWVEEVAFHNIVVWNSAEQLAQRIRKGTRLYVEGRIQTRSWDDKEGKRQYKTEIVADRVLLIARYEGSNDDGGGMRQQSEKAQNSEPEYTPNDSIDPNDLPF